MYIYRVLMNKDTDNRGLVPYNFGPKYSVVEIITSRQHLIAETIAQPPPFSVLLQLFLRILFDFLPNICVKILWFENFACLRQS